MVHRFPPQPLHLPTKTYPQQLLKHKLLLLRQANRYSPELGVPFVGKCNGRGETGGPLLASFEPVFYTNPNVQIGVEPWTTPAGVKPPKSQS